MTKSILTPLVLLASREQRIFIKWIIKENRMILSLFTSVIKPRKAHISKKQQEI